MISAAILASLHYLALGIGLGSVFMRGRYLKELRSVSAVERKATIKGLFVADNIWGIAALLWVITGLLRAFGGYEKGTAFYLANHWFFLKMALVLFLFALEVPPMVTFIKWRIALGRGQVPNGSDDAKLLRRLWNINHIELVLVLLIPFIASIMARRLN